MGFRHWTQIATRVEKELTGLDRKARSERLRDLAANLGVEAHTLRRHLALSAFLTEIGVRDDERRRLPVGPLEVVLRIWQRDPAAAAAALRRIRAGDLSFRAALALERKLRSAQGSEGDARRPDEIYSRIASRFGVPEDSLVELSQLDDPRFEIVQVQRVFSAGASSFAFLDEAATSDGLGAGLIDLIRRALLASALFDGVLVALTFFGSWDRTREVLRLVRHGSAENVVIDAPRAALNAAPDLLEDDA